MGGRPGPTGAVISIGGWGGRGGPEGPRKYTKNIGNPYQMEDNKNPKGAARSAAPLGRRRRRRLVVFHLVRISYVFALFPEPVLARFLTEFADSESFPADSDSFPADSESFPRGLVSQGACSEKGLFVLLIILPGRVMSPRCPQDIRRHARVS